MFSKKYNSMSLKHAEGIELERGLQPLSVSKCLSICNRECGWENCWKPQSGWIIVLLSMDHSNVQTHKCIALGARVKSKINLSLGNIYNNTINYSSHIHLSKHFLCSKILNIGELWEPVNTLHLWIGRIADLGCHPILINLVILCRFYFLCKDLIFQEMEVQMHVYFHNL